MPVASVTASITAPGLTASLSPFRRSLEVLLRVTILVGLWFVPWSLAADVPTDWELLKTKAEAGDHKASYELGRAYLRGEGVPRNLVEAKRLLEPAANAGHPEAMGAYGVMLARGLGVNADPAAGYAFIAKAAEAGVLSARLNQGIMMLRGQGTTRDVAAGLRLMTLAAEAGHADAQARLAEVYYFGEDGLVPKSEKAAAPWALKAAEGGHAWAQNLVGTMKEHGLGMERDPVGASAFYRRAALQGNAKAQSALGRMLHNGLSIVRDRIEAYYWLRASADQGEVTARNFFAEVESGFTPEEREAGEKRLRESPPPTEQSATRPRRGPGPPIPREPAPK
ncbi:MAG: tetratricopeptide repeat protein [Verrucomicrobiales bacterium]